MKKLYKLLYIFIITSICGYFVELIWSFVTKGIFINHSAVVIGPFNFAYGICGIVLTLLLYRFKDESYLKIFILSFIGGSILEYIMSWGMELVLGFTAWDYSDKLLNINGRICLKNSLSFGVLSLFIIYAVTPGFYFLFSLLDFKVWLILAIIFTVIFVLDVIYSVIIAYNLRNRIIIVEELKNEKIAKIPVIFEKRLKESIAGFKAFPNRLLKAFPNLDNNVFEMMKKWKEEAKDKKKEEKEHKKDN